MKKLKRTTKEFIADAKRIHGNKYTYLTTAYTGSKEKVEVWCNTCKEYFYIEAVRHAGNSKKTQCGCKKCSLNKRHGDRRTPLTDLIVQLSEVHNNKFIYCYDPENYHGTRGTIKRKCTKCGTVTSQTIRNQVQGKGCSSCPNKATDYNKAGLLYYVSIDDGAYFKIGITSRDVKSRFLGETSRIEVIKTWDYPLLRDALKKEQEIRTIYKDALIKDKKILIDGNTEIFRYDVLGLFEG